MLKDCPKDVNLMRAAKSRMEYMEWKKGRKRDAHTVLFALCQQLSCDTDSDSNEVDASEETEDATDQEMFSTLMAEFDDEVNGEVPDKEENGHLVDIDLDVYILDVNKKEFFEACIDTGASVSLVGREKAEPYCRMMGEALVVEKRQGRTFKFGTLRKPSLGVIKIRFPYACNRMIDIYLDVIDINVSLLMGLDRLDEYKLYVSNMKNI